MKKKTALILGVSGQDGAYLADHLLKLGYSVIGSSRDAQVCDRSRLMRLGIADLLDIISIAPNDFRSVLSALIAIRPDEIYNLSGQTSVGLSFNQPVECHDSISNATLTILEAIRFAKLESRFFNAGSSECFGDTGELPADENTPFRPRSPYGIAKSSAFWNVVCYRQSYDLFCCTGILGNHESPLRPERFVTMKIIKAVQRIHQGQQTELTLGRTDIIRDWGWAPDYVKAMHLMLQADTPTDYVIGSGWSHSLERFVEVAFQSVGLDYNLYLKRDTNLERPNELKVSTLNPSLIRERLGWKTSVNIREIARRMIE